MNKFSKREKEIFLWREDIAKKSNVPTSYIFKDKYISQFSKIDKKNDNLKKKLVASDVSVVSCTINVVCELAAKRPRKYVSLVPFLFTILETSQNNWMLIKIVKLVFLSKVMHLWLAL